MIPGKIITSLAKFQGIVSENNFRLPIRLQELLQAPLCFMRSFCFERIRMGPLSGQVLHHDCISVFFRDSQSSLRTLWSAVIKSPKFSARGTTASARLPQEALVILVLWQISQFRSFGKWEKTVFTQIRTSRRRRRLCVQTLCHPQDSPWILAALPLFRNGTGLPVLDPDSYFYLEVSEEHARSCLATLSLDTVEDVVGGEVDEHEEDVGWSISCLESVMDVEESKLEEELADKRGTTIGTKFSVLHCIRIPFFMRCGFWPLIHSYEYPCSSQSFPSD